MAALGRQGKYLTQEFHFVWPCCYKGHSYSLSIGIFQILVAEPSHPVRIYDHAGERVSMPVLRLTVICCQRMREHNIVRTYDERDFAAAFFPMFLWVCAASQS